jgi:hypothetical protein
MHRNVHSDSRFKPSLKLLEIMQKKTYYIKLNSTDKSLRNKKFRFSLSPSYAESLLNVITFTQAEIWVCMRRHKSTHLYSLSANHKNKHYAS